MTFSRARVISTFDYNLNGETETLHHTMGPVKVLGIFFYPKLKFDCHIINIVNRSNKILVFIRGNCVEFNDTITFKSIN